MTITIPLVLLLAALLIWLIATGRISILQCLPPLLLGFYLASTGLGTPGFAATDTFLNFLSPYTS